MLLQPQPQHARRSPAWPGDRASRSATRKFCKALVRLPPAWRWNSSAVLRLGWSPRVRGKPPREGAVVSQGLSPARSCPCACVEGAAGGAGTPLTTPEEGRRCLCAHCCHIPKGAREDGGNTFFFDHSYPNLKRCWYAQDERVKVSLAWLGKQM